MTKRIVRAKRKIVEAGICFSVPQGEELRDRLSEVLTSVYAMFGESYLSSGPDATERAELAAEAEWFATLLHQLMPEEPEVTGLLALIRLNQARRLARFDSDEHLILLKDQNRGLWDRAAIEDAVALLNRALAASRPGPFQAQAAIAACHALTRRREDTGWDRIVALYDTLLCLGPSPIASLNRAIALR